MSDQDPPRVTRRSVLQASVAALAASGAVSSMPVAQAASPEPDAGKVTAASYILKRLSQYNVKHLFGVPGATCDALFLAALASDVAPVICASDLEAGYAADAYARRRGLGAVAVSYGVGTLSLANAIAGAMVERSPLVLFSGGPSADDLAVQKTKGVLFSHSIGKEDTDLTVMRELTVFAGRARAPAEVPELVDHGLMMAMRQSRPVYIEIAKDVWNRPCPAPKGKLVVDGGVAGNETVAARAILARLRAAHRPALLLGIEIARFGLGKNVAELVRRLSLPWATTLLAKSVIAEDTPGFAGVHDGERAPESLRRIIEDSDLLVAIGCVFGRQHRRLVERTSGHLVRIADGSVTVPGQDRLAVNLPALVDSLLVELPSGYKAMSVHPPTPTLHSEPSNGGELGLTYDEVMAAVGDVLDASFVALTDTSLSMYAAGELKVAGSDAYLGNAVWQSIGYGLAAAIGVGLSGPRRPLVVCGDGGFQIAAQSLSTLARYKVPALVVVLDNGLYGIEQYLLAPAYFAGPAQRPRPYLELHRWNYADIAKAMGFGQASSVSTPATLRQALTQARDARGPSLIHAIVRPHDLPSQLRPV